MLNPDRELAIAQHREFYSGIHTRRELQNAGICDAFWYGERIDRLGRLLLGEDFSGDWRSFRGRNILDLGCGWDWEPPSIEKSYAPYFCRILAGQGANVVGIDGAGAINHDFLLYTHITADIVPWIMNGKLHELEKAGSLTTIKGIQFDIINCKDVISTHSPDLGMEGYLKRLCIEIPTIRQALVVQSPKLLREGGILALDGDWYRNTQGTMVPL